MASFSREVVILFLLTVTHMSRSVYCQKHYDMDKLSTCGRTINADDNGVIINGKGDVSPSNPPLQCVVYLRSIYTRSDGSNKMQIEVQSLSIRDSAITLDIFEGRKSAGRYIKRLSYRESSTSIIYSQTNEITIRLSRPNDLYQQEYRFRLLIKPWKDRDVLLPTDGKEVLSIGAIIGIVFGCLIVVAVIILFCWCCCTGRISGFKGRHADSKDSSKFVNNQNLKQNVPGVDNRALATEKGKPGVINFNDPQVWNTVTTGNYDNQRSAPRYHQRNAPQHDYRNGGRNREYEPYEFDRQQGRPAYERQYGPSQTVPGRNYVNVQRTSAPRQNRVQEPTKETLIDDVFDSDSQNQNGDAASTDVDDETLQKRPHGAKAESPKQVRKEEKSLPEEKRLDGSPQLERYKSMDLQSQPDLETIRSPLHVNAGVRASVEDEEDVSPTNSLRKQKKAGASPKSKRGRGREPDPSAMPPEASDPIFSGPISGINYPGHNNMAPMYPGGFMPYGLIPAMQFAPGAPGTQTYAYAYQTDPASGAPGAQGAYMVQNTPTSDGNRRTAFAVEHTLSPDKYNPASPKDKRGKNSDPFRRNENRLSGGSKRSKGRDRDHDLDIITRGAAPPDPGQGHRSVAMKSGTDPNSGIQTTQVLWTDTVPDATDPKPGENPQVTRKTITRVTTKSGFGDLPPEPLSLLELNDAEPDFLSPNPIRTHKALSPSHPNTAARYTPDRSNIAFYTGAGAGAGTGSSQVMPERSSTPNSMHHPPSYNSAIRDRIPLDDSTV